MHRLFRRHNQTHREFETNESECDAPRHHYLSRAPRIYTFSIVLCKHIYVFVCAQKSAKASITGWRVGKIQFKKVWISFSIEGLSFFTPCPLCSQSAPVSRHATPTALYKRGFPFGRVYCQHPCRTGAFSSKLQTHNAPIPIRVAQKRYLRSIERTFVRHRITIWI